MSAWQTMQTFIGLLQKELSVLGLHVCSTTYGSLQKPICSGHLHSGYVFQASAARSPKTPLYDLDPLLELTCRVSNYKPGGALRLGQPYKR